MKLTSALRAVRAAPNVQTKEFTVLCDQIIHLMDFLGKAPAWTFCGLGMAYDSE